MTERTIAYYSCAIPIWITFVYKLYDLRRGTRDPMRLVVCAALFCIAGVLTCSAPATMSFINGVSGVSNLAMLVSFSVVVGLGASGRLLVVYWHDASAQSGVTAKRWVIAHVVVILVMVALFLAGDAPVERRTDFETYYATTPFIVEFVLIYLLAQAVALVSVVWRCWQWARIVGQPWLRRGLYMIATGALCGIGVSACRTTAVVARWFGRNWDQVNTHLSVVFAIVGLSLAALGFALPTWGRHLSRLRGWLGRYHGYRSLYPLWDALRTATPTIVLPVRIPWWDFELRLTRRLAEINDGRLALRPHVDQRVAARAAQLGEEAGLSEADLAAVVEAARLRGAMAAKAADIEHRPGGEPHHHPLGAADGIDELTWLSAVSRAFRHSPLVVEAVAGAPPVSRATG